MSKERIKLVIIDNILTVCDYFIKADGTVDFFERAHFLVSHSRKLKKLAYNHNLIVVILNNVVADVE